MIFHRKNVFRQKIFFFAVRILYMFMHTKYHGGTPKTCIGKKLLKTYHFYLWILRILLVLDTDWRHSLRASDRKSSKFPDFSICQCYVLVRNFFKNKYFFMGFFLKGMIEQSILSTYPEGKLPRTKKIGSILSGRFSKISKMSTFGDSIHPIMGSSTGSLKTSLEVFPATPAPCTHPVYTQKQLFGILAHMPYCDLVRGRVPIKNTPKWTLNKNAAN